MTVDDPSGRPSAGQTSRPPARVRLAAARDCFVALVDAEYHQVARFVMLNGAGQDQALDATQAAFTEAWALMRRDQWDTVRHPRAWLRTIALRSYRRPPGRRREPPTVLDDSPEELIVGGGPDPAELTVQALDVLRALRTLPEDLRVVMAFHIDGVRPVEIAAELGISDQRARDLLKRGRARLAAALGLEEKG